MNKLKHSVNSGSINDMETRRRYRQQLEDAKLPARLDHEYNRFHGLETPIDFILHKATVEKEASTKDAFTKKLIASIPKIDMIHETKKLHLLQEKRAVLKQVIALTQQDIAQRERESASVHHAPSGRGQVVNISNNTFNICRQHDVKQRKLAEWRAGQNQVGPALSSRSRGGSASSVASRGSTASWASFATSSAPKPISRQGRGAAAAARVPALNLARK